MRPRKEPNYNMCLTAFRAGNRLRERCLDLGCASAGALRRGGAGGRRGPRRRSSVLQQPIRQPVRELEPDGAAARHRRRSSSPRTRMRTRPGGGLEIFSMEDDRRRRHAPHLLQHRRPPLRLPRGRSPARRGRARPCGASWTPTATAGSRATDGESLRIVDLERAVEGELVAGNAHVSGADWSPGEEILYYSGGRHEPRSTTSTRSRATASPTRTSPSTAALRERRPRFNLGGTSLAFERIDATGKGQIWIATSLGLRALTTGGPGTRRWRARRTSWARTPTPCSRRTGGCVLFRRLMATGNGGLGVWDFMTIRTDVTGATAVPFVTGARLPRRRRTGTPTGIVFVEVAPGSGPQLVFVDAHRRRAPRADDGGRGVPDGLPALADGQLARTSLPGRPRSCPPPPRRRR